MFSSISIFFRLLNLASFVGLIFYFFYKKSVPKLRQKIQEKKAMGQILQHKHEQLLHQEQDLKNELDAQKILYSSLIEKVHHWQRTVAHHQKNIQQEQAMRMEHVKEKIARQEYVQAQKKLEMEVIPEAVQHARLQLCDTFSSPEASNSYIHVILNSIQKSL